jgi:peroxiredoxin Q/BCP
LEIDAAGACLNFVKGDKIMLSFIKKTSVGICAAASTLGSLSSPGLAGDQKIAVGKPAPLFEAKTQDGKMFKLADRKGQGFTVLFFYPKAGTPGCTKQACAFRDSIKVIRAEGAEVYGISADSVAAQKAFHTEHHMTFDLISDENGKIIEMYQVKMPVVSMAKRQTFIVDKDLVIRKHFEDVDPSLDAKNVAQAIKDLKK